MTAVAATPHVRYGHGLASAARAISDPTLAHYLTNQAPAAVVAGAALPLLPGREAA